MLLGNKYTLFAFKIEMIDEIDVIGMRESKQFSIKSIRSIKWK